MRRRLAARLTAALRAARIGKSSSTMALVGCDLPFLVSYIESKFKPGMTWQNVGRKKGGWELDHIRPCASFDLSDPTQQRECFHYSNLQPLWWHENARKSAKVLTA